MPEGINVSRWRQPADRAVPTAERESNQQPVDNPEDSPVIWNETDQLANEGADERERRR
jgi:hypothetical protein